VDAVGKAMEDPRISLVVEWDNARYREIERARRMLRGVVAQLTELDAQAEVLVVYDGLVVEDVVVKTVVEEARRMAPNRVEFLSICAPGSRYDQLKNVGARRAHGTILVFVDSDVLPEAGWLPALLGSFDDPNIEAVIANTYVDTDTICGKIFALCWHFPLRQLDGPLVPTTSSFVNSLAVRRSMFERHPFPEGRKLYTGQRLNHVGTLRDNGVAVYFESASESCPPAADLRTQRDHQRPRRRRSSEQHGA
jgi:hypothetical protein